MSIEGMDAAEVHRIASKLDVEAGRVMSRIDAIDATVSKIIRAWMGRDAQDFNAWWQRQHRPALLHAHEAVEGLAQSLRNNAQAQDTASAAWGGTSSAGASAAAASVGAATVAAAAAGAAPAGASAPLGAGGTSGALPDSNRSAAEVDAAYRANSSRFGLGAYGASGSYKYQCTSWAEYRWRELGYKGPIGDGNGWQKAHNNGGTTGTAPTLGAMASYGNGQAGSYGHVMIVEEVAKNSAGATRIRVSEMNVGDNDFENGHPDEYRSNSWLVQDAAGSWKREAGRAVGAVTFATLPG